MPSRNIGTGLLLGGGLSYLSPGHGFSVDTLLEADVVLVNGTLVTATSTNQYADLFKALKVCKPRSLLSQLSCSRSSTPFPGCTTR